MHTGASVCTVSVFACVLLLESFYVYIGFLVSLFHGVLFLCVVGQHEFPHNFCIHVASYGYLQIHCTQLMCTGLGLVVDIALDLIDDGCGGVFHGVLLL